VARAHREPAVAERGELLADGALVQLDPEAHRCAGPGPAPHPNGGSKFDADRGTGFRAD
jgi:hypothetical protein